MSEQSQDRTQVRGGAMAQDETFANLLGEGWQSAGDGIYRRIVDAAEDADEFVEDLMSDGEVQLPAEKRSPPKTSTRRWLRRGRSH